MNEYMAMWTFALVAVAVVVGIGTSVAGYLSFRVIRYAIERQDYYRSIGECWAEEKSIVWHMAHTRAFEEWKAKKDKKEENK